MIISKDTTKKQDFLITIDNKPLRHSPQLKILGNLFSDDLTWTKHVQQIVIPGLRNRIRTIKTNLKILGPEIQGQLCQLYLQIQTTVCSRNMGGVQKTTLQEVQKIQDQATKLAVGQLHPRDSTRKRQARL